MHELSLVMSLLQTIEALAREQGFVRVMVIHLEVGRLSGVVPESLELCFQVARSGTVAEEAVLMLERPVGRACCSSCGLQQEIEDLVAPCAGCGEHGLRLMSGDGLRITAMEVV